MENHGSALLLQIDEQVTRRHLLKHPFYQDWQAGRLDRAALQLYAGQYYRHVEAFPKHLRRLAERAHGELRELIQENLAEEENPRRTHPQLWRDFAAAVGTTAAALDHSPALPGVQVLVDTYGVICGERPLAERWRRYTSMKPRCPRSRRRRSRACGISTASLTRGV